MSTFLHGVGTVQYLDKSGEVVDLKGLDISSLPLTGVINYEHKSDVPAQLVGKILKAKKIFKQSDCSDDHELHFWKKVKTPYLYIMAELLDDYCDSAKHVAGILRYDRDKKDQNKYAMTWFSVEGSEIPGSRTNSQIVSRGIARKVTLTTTPCNQGCSVEILENQSPQVKDDFDSIFKSKEEAITLFKSGEGVKIYQEYLAKKEADAPSIGGPAPKNPYNEYENKGIRIGTNKSGKHVYSHGHVGSYGFNPAEHKEAAEHHRRAAVMADNPKLIDNHLERMKQHNNAALNGGRQENRAALSLKDKDRVAQEQGKQQMEKKEAEAAPHKMSVSEAPKTFGQRPKNNGIKIGATTSGKEVFSHGKVGSYGFDSGEHKEAAVLHGKAAAAAKNAKLSDNHTERMRLHNQAAVGLANKSSRLNPGGKNKMVFAAKKPVSKKEKICEMHLKKAIEAGSYNAAPSTLVNGAAYQTESMGSKQAFTGAEEHNFQGTPKKKKDWNKRANEDYDKWPHKEKFESFMKARMPHLADGEIRALGKAMALKKNVDLEKSLRDLISIKKKEENPKLGNHFLFSAENPMHPHKNEMKMDHKQTLSHLKQKGFNAHEVKGHYGAPETSIMVHNVSPDQAEHLHGIASKLGQDSSIYSNGGKHEMRFHHGENAGKKVHGEGTVWHKDKPKDFYTTMPNGQHFTHNFDFNKSEETAKELDEKSLKDIQIETAKKWADRAEEAYKKAIDEKSIKWLLEADEYFHEAIEHSSLSEDLSTFEDIRAKLMPKRKQAFKLLAPDADA